jgi:hypothetical protein
MVSIESQARKGLFVRRVVIRLGWYVRIFRRAGRCGPTVSFAMDPSERATTRFIRVSESYHDRPGPFPVYWLPSRTSPVRGNRWQTEGARKRLFLAPNENPGVSRGDVEYRPGIAAQHIDVRCGE